MSDDLGAQQRQGVYFALSAYAFWGVAPVYFKWVAQVSPWEILSHRVIWALILLLAILAYMGELRRLKVPLSTLPRILVSATLISANWLVFIYAVVNNNITETALGYFINPLVSIFLGVTFLHESLRPLQWTAVGIAAIGILIQVLLFGQVPWIALALAFSFGFYGLYRKSLGLHAVAGLALETALVLPVALMFLVLWQHQGAMVFGTDIETSLLLMLGGFVTAFPLLCFAAAVTRLSLTVLGFIQYLAPSVSLLLAVFYYGEPFDTGRLISFSCIWAALAIFSTESWYHQRKMRRISLS